MDLYKTLQDEMKEACKQAKTNMDLIKIANEFAIKVIDSDPIFWGIEKRWSSYGTWKVRINFANEYHYGNEIAKALTSIGSIITHDEDKVFTIEDFADYIEDALFDVADELCDEEGGEQ